MKLTRLLIAAVVMAGLGGVLYWSNKQEAAKAAKPAADAPPTILSLKDSDIKQVEIDQRGAEPTIVQKDGSGQWKITAPRALPADQSAMSGITGAVTDLKSERLVDSNATDLASYGLAPPVVAAKFTTADGKTSTLLIGEDTPASGSVYAKLENDPRLFTMYKSTRDSLDKGVKDLRDRRLMTFDRDKTSRVELDIAKQPAIEFGRIGQNEWQFLKPKPMRADGFQVEDLLSRLKDAQMDASVSDADAKKNAASFNSGQPLATVTVTDPGGAQKMEVHKSGEDYYAKSSVIEGVNKLSADLGKMLDKKADDFRNKKVFDFGFNDPTRIEVKDGAKTAVYEKSGDNWVSGGKNMDALSVQALIDKLRDLSATKFPDSGFTTPALELTVVSDSGKRTEKVQIAAAGKDFIARRENGPALYQVDGSTIEELRKTAGDIKEAQAQAKK